MPKTASASQSTSPARLVVEPYHESQIPSDSWIWVFGSDEAGKHRHGDGKIAHVSFRAPYGVGRGPLRGAYGIPVLDKTLKAMDAEAVKRSVGEFIEYALENPGAAFHIARPHCGNLSDEELAQMFKQCPSNCSLPTQWRDYV